MTRYSCHGGHNSLVQGANSGQRKEHIMDRQVKDAVVAKLRQLGHTVYDDTDETGSTQAANLNNIVRNCNSHDVDLVISFHLNAYNGSANGVEVCYYDQEALAAKVSAQLAKDIGWSNRGAKPRTDLYVLNSTKAPAILIELGFIDNDADMAKFNVDKIANSIVYALTGQTVGGGGGTIAPPTNDLKLVATGGIGFDRMKETADFLNTLGYGASIVISGKNDGTFFIRSDRRVGSDLDKLTAWLDAKQWWYQYE
jgi:N-acetylmuramoyl-L-alanine amidase